MGTYREVVAALELRAAVADSRRALTRALNAEISRWNNVGAAVVKARMWAALEWWVTEDDVLEMARWVLEDQPVSRWSRAEAAEVATAMLEGWVWRTQQRKPLTGAG